MKRTFIGIFATLGLASSVSASCYLGTNTYSCSDLRSGNVFKAHQYGNSAFMAGYDMNTGSSVLHMDHQFGDTSFLHGTDAYHEPRLQTFSLAGYYGYDANIHNLSGGSLWD